MKKFKKTSVFLSMVAVGFLLISCGKEERDQKIAPSSEIPSAVSAPAHSVDPLDKLLEDIESHDPEVLDRVTYQYSKLEDKIISALKEIITSPTAQDEDKKRAVKSLTILKTEKSISALQEILSEAEKGTYTFTEDLTNLIMTSLLESKNDRAYLQIQLYILQKKGSSPDEKIKAMKSLQSFIRSNSSKSFDIPRENTPTPQQTLDGLKRLIHGQSSSDSISLDTVSEASYYETINAIYDSVLHPVSIAIIELNESGFNKNILEEALSTLFLIVSRASYFKIFYVLSVLDTALSTTENHPHKTDLEQIREEIVHRLTDDPIDEKILVLSDTIFRLFNVDDTHSTIAIHNAVLYFLLKTTEYSPVYFTYYTAASYSIKFFLEHNQHLDHNCNNEDYDSTFSNEHLKEISISRFFDYMKRLAKLWPSEMPELYDNLLNYVLYNSKNPNLRLQTFDALENMYRTKLAFKNDFSWFQTNFLPKISSCFLYKDIYKDPTLLKKFLSALNEHSLSNYYKPDIAFMEALLQISEGRIEFQDGDVHISDPESMSLANSLFKKIAPRFNGVINVKQLLRPAKKDSSK